LGAESSGKFGAQARNPLANRFVSALNFNWIPLPARGGKGLGGQEAATAASDATPDGEAPLCAIPATLLP
jgi:hypothetical protein